jgi:hypothetical protein
MFRNLPCVAILAVLGAIGCGDAKPVPKEDRDIEKITAVLRGLPDVASNPARASEFFAAGMVPSEKELSRYAGWSYDLTAPPTIAGDTATVRVQIQSLVKGLAPQGKEGEGPTMRKQADWSFVRDGDRWKLKSAPLP